MRAKIYWTQRARRCLAPLRVSPAIVIHLLVSVSLSVFLCADETGGHDQSNQLVEAEQLMALGYIDSSSTFFDRDGVTKLIESRSQPGHNLYLSAHASEAVLMDMDGAIIHTWGIDADQLAGLPTPPHMPDPWPPFWRKVHLLDGGDLLAIHEGYGVVRLDRESKIRWIVPNGAHHDLWETDDGRIFVLARTLVTDSRLRAEGPVLNDQILEIDAKGKTIGNWSILEGLLSSPASKLLESSHGHPGDPLHCNSIQVVEPADASSELGIHEGDFVISSRHIDAVLAYRPTTREVTWVLTGVATKQHDARLSAGGILTLFDNSDPETGSRALMINLKTSTELRSVPESPSPDRFSRCCGTTQLLDNGNLLTTFTEESIAVETDPQGEIVWEFRNPHHSVAPQRINNEERAMLFEVERIYTGRSNTLR